MLGARARRTTVLVLTLAACPGASRAGTEPAAVANAFDEANPGYAERAGTFYEKEYLPAAVDQLAAAVGANATLAAALRENLQSFIHDWLEVYVRGGGRMDGPALAATLERLDARMKRALDAGQLDAYWKWRIGEDRSGNALAFLMQYREPSPRPAAATGSVTARTLDAIDRLAPVETVEATRSLLGMMDTGDGAVLMHAARNVTARLPIPDYPGHGCPFTDLRRDQVRRNLSAKAWSAELAPKARAFARQLLRREALHDAAVGAMMITCIGEVEDLPAVADAMGHFLDGTADPEAPPSYMPASFEPFLMASQGLLYRGARPKAVPATTGDIAVYLGAVMILPEERPRDWRKRATSWRRHPVPYIRRIAAFVLD